jgi:hypothetical protein
VGAVLGAWEPLQQAMLLPLKRWPGGGESLEALPRSWIWLWTGAFTFGVVASIVSSPNLWQRVVLMVSAFGITAAWWPILWLFGRSPDLAIPLVALVWGCLGASLYAARHGRRSGSR